MRDPGKGNIRKINFDDQSGVHFLTTIETPLRVDAFKLGDELKIELIENKFKDIMEILDLDLTDESLKDTPKRVAKMYVTETFSGLNPENKPKPTLIQI
jgi:GTP cyclohydrolase I